MRVILIVFLVFCCGILGVFRGLGVYIVVRFWVWFFLWMVDIVRVWRNRVGFIFYRGVFVFFVG